MLLGEARSKCEHVASVPLPPWVAAALHQLYLAKGVQATTAIEGNTLSLEQVEKHLTGKLVLPPSQQYMQKEVENVLAACKIIGTEKFHEENPLITPGLIQYFNRVALDGLECEEGVVGGKIRTHSVTVARYLGAPAEDCEYLLERLCAWLNSQDFAPNPELGLAVPILKAILAHLYIAWIHPFGDGNGRTARLIEFYILVHAGVSTPAAHLLSNHYNLTRTAYYRELDRSSRASGGDVKAFVLYALQGFVDQLREQIARIQMHHIDIAWRDLVNERFEGMTSQAELRRRNLLLDISWQRPMRRREMLEIPAIEKAYRGKTVKTLTRDLNALITEDLIERTPEGFRARCDQIFAFLPHQRLPEHEIDEEQLELELPE